MPELKKIVLPILTGLLLLGGCQPESDPTATLETPDAPVEDQNQSHEETTQLQSDDAPFFLTTMTHMESNHRDDEIKDVFLIHVEQLRYAMHLADDYGAILTFEAEKPFARANLVWGLNIAKEVIDKGHGFATHCDIGATERNLAVEDFAKMFKENKTLIDELIGPENNTGCSGGGSATDWVLAATEAGFQYINGIVGFHLLAVEVENRPDQYSNDYIINGGGFHDNIPSSFPERVYPVLLKDATDLEFDADGTIVMSPGSLGRLDAFAEGGRDACVNDRCLMTTEDVDLLVTQLIEIDNMRDRSKVAKVDVYFPVHNWEASNEDALRYFFSEMERLQAEGILQWASQKEAVDAYLQWNNISL